MATENQYAKINYVISLLNEGAINFEDLENFSDGLKETVGAFIDR